MQIIQKLKDKKVRYILFSLVMVGLLFRLSVLMREGESFSTMVVLVFVVALLGTFFTQFSPITDYRSLIVGILPLSLTLGTILTLYYFPNFSLAFRLLELGVVGFLYYLINLANNIFLVVEEKEETIPLYRVASTWGQILIVVISILLFTGVFKTNTFPIIQALYAGTISFVFTLYYFWTLSYDKRVRRIKKFEVIINSLLSLFFVAAASISVSFIPTEAFLRALFTASVLLFNLNYLDAYMKNRINRGLIYQYGLIFLIFLSFVLIF